MALISRLTGGDLLSGSGPDACGDRTEMGGGSRRRVLIRSFSPEPMTDPLNEKSAFRITTLKRHIVHLNSMKSFESVTAISLFLYYSNTK